MRCFCGQNDPHVLWPRDGATYELNYWPSQVLVRGVRQYFCGLPLPRVVLGLAETCSRAEISTEAADQYRSCRVHYGISIAQGVPTIAFPSVRPST
ncbi:hypothetical protein N7510_003599 [Penicillium lagena]|uniref:uncharacterized protein n=1 Tax=Penicillium lagena TaxID=94218 RepID=UPI002540C5BE|nr:uncharacterized protein N7510_003599 [Penicillium lagena]KAJ5619615.1 hypothetical protein N7510_003599 [Penicillium lagena]